MEDKDIIKHSAAIHISNNINLFQRKTWNVLLANAYEELETKEIHEVDVSELLEVLDVRTRNFDHIKKSVEALAKTSITWNILGKDKEKDHEWGVMNLLAEAKMRNGKLSYAYPPTMRSLLHNPNWYAKIKLSLQNKFITKHGLTLFEICADYYIAKNGFGTTGWIELGKLKELMGLGGKDGESEKYGDFKVFNRAVIKSALNEVNKAKVFVVDVEYSKEARRVVAVKFNIRGISGNGGEAKRLPAGKAKRGHGNEELFQRLQSHFCLSEEEAAEAMAAYGEEYIAGNLEVVERKYVKGRITESIGAYTLKALDVDFRPKKSAFEAERDERKAAKDKDAAELEGIKVEFGKAYKAEAERVFAGLSGEDREALTKGFEEEKVFPHSGLVGMYRKLGLGSAIFRSQFESYVMAKLASPALCSLPAFAESRGVRLEKTAEGDYRILPSEQE